MVVVLLWLHPCRLTSQLALYRADALRHDFANVANPFYDHLQAIRSALHSTATDLPEQLALFTAKTEELQSLAPQLGPIEEAEKKAHTANIEDNECSNHTFEDLAFEYEQLSAVFAKKVSFIESQIAADQSLGVSAEQLQEFKELFSHFDIDGDRKLSKYVMNHLLSFFLLLPFFFHRHHLLQGATAHVLLGGSQARVQVVHVLAGYRQR